MTILNMQVGTRRRRGRRAWRTGILALVAAASLAIASGGHLPPARAGGALPPLPVPDPVPAHALIVWVDLSADNTTPTDGDTVTLTASTNFDVGPTPYTINIVDQSTGESVGSCASGTSCQAEVTNWEEAVTYVARVGPAYASEPVEVQWSEAPAPRLSVAYDQVTWSNVAHDSHVTAKPIAVTNTGDAPLDIYGIAITNYDRYGHYDFGETDTCAGTTLEPGESCTITPTFSTEPDGCGSYHAEIDFDSNDSQFSDPISLSATVIDGDVCADSVP
jgi:hypothetical protein